MQLTIEQNNGRFGVNCPGKGNSGLPGRQAISYARRVERTFCPPLKARHLLATKPMTNTLTQTLLANFRLIAVIEQLPRVSVMPACNYETYSQISLQTALIDDWKVRQRVASVENQRRTLVVSVGIVWLAKLGVLISKYLRSLASTYQNILLDGVRHAPRLLGCITNTTFARKIEERLGRRGFEVHFTKESLTANQDLPSPSHA